MRHALHVTSAVALIAIGAVPGLAQQTMTVTTATSDEYGDYLVDGAGQPLYLFTADTQGAEAAQGMGAVEPVSACEGDCLRAWPPVPGHENPMVEGEVPINLISTFPRADSSVQMTFNGWPLYYFQRDAAGEAPAGHEIESFGGEWYLVTPEGERIGEDG
jgi:predicted lipoprotein with Yx(FWY)xxD motif